MKISTTDSGIIEFREVYNGIVLITDDGEQLFVSMRDSGFELSYKVKDSHEYKIISAKNGIVKDKL